MLLWVTRPKAAGERTAAHLAVMGHDVLALPLAKATHAPQNTRLALENRPSALAITSAQALDTLAMLGDALAPYRAIPVFAVGHATAAAARHAGFLDVHSANGTADDLARSLVSTMEQGKGHVLYLAGHPRSDRLETAMQHHGIGFETAECYRMHPISYGQQELETLVAGRTPEGVLFYSRETAMLFFALPAFASGYNLLQESWFFCFSRNVAAVVPQELKHRIKIAAEPNEKALFALLG